MIKKIDERNYVITPRVTTKTNTAMVMAVMVGRVVTERDTARELPATRKIAMTMLSGSPVEISTTSDIYNCR